jgi:hypothetical protein
LRRQGVESELIYPALVMVLTTASGLDLAAALTHARAAGRRCGRWAMQNGPKNFREPSRACSPHRTRYEQWPLPTPAMRAVMPQCNHGGPEHAANCAKLAELYGLRFHRQRLAVQGSTASLTALQSKAVPLH